MPGYLYPLVYITPKYIVLNLIRYSILKVFPLKGLKGFISCHGTARDTRYARRVAFLFLFNIARQIAYPPRLPLYRFSLSRIPVKLSSNPLESSTTAVRSYQFYEFDACSSSVRM